MIPVSIESLSAVYRNFIKTTCGVRALRDIYYGYVDCLEAAKEWRDILAVHLDEPSDFEAFKVLTLDDFWLYLGAPVGLPEYPAAWDFAADMAAMLRENPGVNQQLAWLPKDPEDLSLGHGLAVVGPGLLEFLGIEEE